MSRRPHGGPDEGLVDRIAAYLQLGAPFAIACKAAGVAESTARYWMREGNRGRAPYARFALAVRAARRARDLQLDALLQRRQHERSANHADE